MCHVKVVKISYYRKSEVITKILTEKNIDQIIHFSYKNIDKLFFSNK
jgi:hypothetical protein